MNKRVFRLVFCRKRGMRVPAAEHVRASGKAGGGQTRAVSVAISALVATLGVGEVDARTVSGTVVRSGPAWTGRTIANPTDGFKLPWRSVETAGKDSGSFSLTYSTEGLSDTPNRLRVDQKDRVVNINWDTFNLGRDTEVIFSQPDATSVAFNKIWDAKPSVILGRISANGHIILENTNGGFIFGPTARVETQRFIATALAMSKEVDLDKNKGDQAAFGNAQSVAAAGITVERGAEIRALAGGQVMLFAPKVYNEGLISTPGGQAILAAGQKVYLMASADATQRGLLVAVDAFQGTADAPLPEGTNTVENAAQGSYAVDAQGRTVEQPGSLAGLTQKINEVVAERGTINLVGMSIRQNGVLTATTAVKGESGAIYIQAGASKRMGTVVLPQTGASDNVIMADQLGDVEFGQGSVTQVKVDASEATQTRAETFYRSRIDVMGSDIRVSTGAQLLAPSGDINLRAAQRTTTADGSDIVLFNSSASAAAPDQSRLLIEQGAVIDVAGLKDVQVDGSRNQMSGQLFKIELADVPVQRGGVLYRQTVSFDAADPINVANVLGFYNSVGRTAQEMATTGGNVRIEGMGAVAVADGAQVKFGGGNIKVSEAVVQTSVLRQGDRLVSLEQAKGSVAYDELMKNQSGSRAVSAYVQGADGGSALVAGASKTVVGLSGFNADVVVGERQRASRLSGAYSGSGDRQGAKALAPSILSSKPYLESQLRPLAGALTIGRSYGQGDVPQHYISEMIVAPQATVRLASEALEMGGTAYDAFFASLPATTTVSAQALSGAHLGQLSLVAQKVAVQAGAQINLAAAGADGLDKTEVPTSLNIDANDTVVLDGAVRAAGGKVSITSRGGDVVLGEGARLDVSGDRIDEMGVAGQGGLSVSGGSVSLTAAHGIALQAGSVVDVSAGAWRNVAGTVTTGKAGAVLVDANKVAPETLGLSALGDVKLAGALRGWGFSQGGSLSVAGIPGLALTGEAINQMAVQGFGTLAYTSQGDLSVQGVVAPVVRSLELAPTRGRATSANMLRLTTLADGLRAGVNLTLKTEAPRQLSYGSLDTLPGHLTVQDGTRIDVGPGGSITLEALRDIQVGRAELIARGGAVAMSLSGSRGSPSAVTSPDDSPDAFGQVDDQVIRLRQGSVIDVSGVARSYRLANGKQVGSVLAGGSVKLNDSGQTKAVRGRVITEQGSTIKLSGAKGVLSIERGTLGTEIEKGAGSLSVASTDGFLLEGDVVADRPSSAVQGAQLSLSVSREGGLDTVKSSGQAYSATERAIVVSASATDLAEHRQEGSNGLGRVAASLINNTGFDRVSLRADERIELGKGVDLKGSAATGGLRSLSLDTAAIDASGGGQHLVQAQAVRLGSQTIKATVGTNAWTTPEATGGDSTLTVKGGLIEAWGHMAFKGADTVNLLATLDANGGDTRRNGEMRLVGRYLPEQTQLTARMAFAKALNISAGQLYATTLTDARVQGASGGSTLSVSSPLAGTSTSASPLSALASLSLQATDIHIDGVVRQPFGSISADAEHALTLGAGSELSVSGEGLSVPVGTTLNQREWVYALAGSADGKVDKALLTTRTLDGLPVSKSISLKGDTLVVDGASQIKAQAGGDIIAPEFVAGAGGSTDATSRANVFAIVPGYAYEFAPQDQEITASAQAAGSRWTVGDQVRVATDNGVLAQGTYTLLPAKYASLPGAVLVSETTLTTGQTLKGVIKQDDGSVIVSGYRTGVGTQLQAGGDDRLALLLEPEATHRAKSADSTVSSLNTLQAAKSNGAAALPGDGGRVALSARTGAFDWAARYDLRSAAGFAGAELDLAMANMKLGAGQATGQGGLIGAEALAATGAASIVLGGTRSDTAEGTVVTAQASTVDVQSDVTLPGELIVVASDALNVADGVTVRSTGADTGRARSLTLSGEGAALVVSNQSQLDVRRSFGSAPVAGSTKALNLGKNVALQGRAVQIDSSGQVNRSGPLTIAAGAVGFGAQRLAIGSDAATDALAIQASQVKDVSRLQLRGYQGIDLIGNVTLGQAGTQEVTLDTATLRGLSNTGNTGNTGESSVQTATVQAQHVTLRNSTGVQADAQATGDTRLVVMASPPVSDQSAEGVTVGAGSQRLAFARAELATTGDIVMRGTGGVSAQGDLVLNAARVTAATRAQSSVSSAGVLTVAAIDAAKTDGSQTAQARTMGQLVGAGASLSLQGQRVVQAGTVDLASGQISIVGTGSDTSRDTVVFDTGSTTRAAGWVNQAGSTWTAVADAGRIRAVASQGDIVVRGTLDVSAPVSTTAGVASGAAGSISLQAVGTAMPGGSGAVVMGSQARLLGSAAQASQSGIVRVDAARILTEAERQNAAAQAGSVTEGLTALARAIESGGNHREVELRVREGDQALHTGITAARVLLTADAGNLLLGSDSQIDARADRGGVVQVSAGKDLTLASGAVILASSSQEGANGGDVLLASSTGTIDLQQDAQVDARGTTSADGRIVLRALAPTTSTIKIKPVAATLKAGEVTAEAVKVFNSTASLTMSSATSFKVGTDGDVIAYANSVTKTQTDAIKKALGWSATDSSLHVRTGLEIRTGGDFTLATDWNLANLRSGGEPIALTVRAQGNVNINANLSDGFKTATRAADTAATPTAMVAGDGASMRLVAGADRSSAGLLQTLNVEKDLTVAADKMVRTSSGSIEVAAARDVVLKANAVSGSTLPRPAVIYVAGRQSTAVAGTGRQFVAPPSTWEQYTDHGGRLDVRAGRDVVAPAISELFGNYLLHTGNPNGVANWWTAFDQFRQGLGSMGGGNVRVTAGRHIQNLGVVATSSGRAVDAPTQDTDADGNTVETHHYSQLVSNGGDMLVRAEGNINGGAYLLSRGTGRIEAGGEIGVGDSVTSKVPQMGLLLGLMDGQWQVQATGDVAMTSVFNPTIMTGLTTAPTTSSKARVDSGVVANFFTYADDAGLSIASSGGSVNWLRPGSANSSLGDAIKTLLTTYVPTGEKIAIAQAGSQGTVAQLGWIANMAPPSLSVQAPVGDITIQTGESLLLYPSAQGNLTVNAGGDVNLGGADQGTSLVLLDVDKGQRLIGSLAAPAINSSTAGSITAPFSARYVASNKATPTAAMTLHEDDTTPARVHAGGSLLFWDGAMLSISKPADVSAGLDIVSPELRTIHFRDSDVTRLAAGRDLLGASSPQGDTARLTGLIQVGGAGELQVEAGRDVNLLTSAGIETTGNLFNPALSATSAHVRVAAGTARTVNTDALAAQYLDGQPQARAELVQHVAQTLGLRAEDLSYDQAWAHFQRLSAANQVAFADRLSRQAFVARYLTPAAGSTDAVWSYVAQVSGVAESDLGSAARQAYEQGQRILVSYMKRLTGKDTLSYDDALQAYRALDASAQATMVDKRGLLDPLVAAGFLVAGTGPDYAQLWRARQTGLVRANMVTASSAGHATTEAIDTHSQAFNQFRDWVLMNEMRRVGSAAGAVADSTNPLVAARRGAVREHLWRSLRQTAEAAGLGDTFGGAGDIDMAGSKVQSRAVGDFDVGGVSLMAPQGSVLVGYNAASATDRLPEVAKARGLISYGGNIDVFAGRDFLVNAQKAFVVGTGNLTVYAAEGDIDSGRGSNTDVAASEVEYRRLEATGAVIVSTPAPISGSGIGIVADAAGAAKGRVTLLAPKGEVRALDAFIRGPEVVVPGPTLGGDNIKSGSGGTASTPVAAVNLSVNTGLGAETASGQAQGEAAKGREKPRDAASVLTVDVLGAGDAATPLPAPAAGKAKSSGKGCDDPKDCAHP